MISIFCSQNRDVNFASPLIERNADTLSHTHCSLIAATRGPTQVQLAHHTQRRGAKLHETYLQLDCGLVACLYSCQTPNFVRPQPSALSPCRERQAERASADQRNQQRGDETILRGRLGGGSTQQVSYKATTLTRNIQQTSAMQQLPLAHPVCRRNRTEASWHLQRTR